MRTGTPLSKKEMCPRLLEETKGTNSDRGSTHHDRTNKNDHQTASTDEHEMTEEDKLSDFLQGLGSVH